MTEIEDTSDPSTELSASDMVAVSDYEAESQESVRSGFNDIFADLNGYRDFLRLPVATLKRYLR